MIQAWLAPRCLAPPMLISKLTKFGGSLPSDPFPARFSTHFFGVVDRARRATLRIADVSTCYDGSEHPVLLRRRTSASFHRPWCREKDRRTTRERCLARMGERRTVSSWWSEFPTKQIHGKDRRQDEAETWSRNDQVRRLG